MNIVRTQVEATLKPDGRTLELDTPLPLSPGRVRVTIEQGVSTGRPGMLEVLDRIHREQQASGRRPMTEGEMEADIAGERLQEDEYDQRWQQIWTQAHTRPSSQGSP